MTGNGDRLARYLRERRAELGISQDSMRDLGGPSPDTVVKFESARVGKNPQERTLIGFDRALSWEPGSSRRILEGGEPTLTAKREDRDTARMLHALGNVHNGQSAPDYSEAGGGWSPVPRRQIQDLVLDAHKLQAITQMPRVSRQDVQEMASRIHGLATGMLALAIAAERGDDDLAMLVNALDPESTETVHVATANNTGIRSDGLSEKILDGDDRK